MPDKRITVIDGHPDPDPARFGHALAAAYAEGGRAAGRKVRLIKIADLDFPLVRSQREWMDAPAPKTIRDAQTDIGWADRIAIIYPLWLGDVPALLKAFLEQVMRPGFALRYGEGGFPQKLLDGRSADVVVTMGMPALFYRAWYGAHSVRSLRRNVLNLVGIAPVDTTLIGNVEASAPKRQRWLERMHELGGRPF